MCPCISENLKGWRGEDAELILGFKLGVVLRGLTPSMDRRAVTGPHMREGKTLIILYII